MKKLVLGLYENLHVLFKKKQRQTFLRRELLTEEGVYSVRERGIVQKRLNSDSDCVGSYCPDEMKKAHSNLGNRTNE